MKYIIQQMEDFNAESEEEEECSILDMNISLSDGDFEKYFESLDSSEKNNAELRNAKSSPTIDRASFVSNEYLSETPESSDESDLISDYVADNETDINNNETENVDIPHMSTTLKETFFLAADISELETTVFNHLKCVSKQLSKRKSSCDSPPPHGHFPSQKQIHESFDDLKTMHCQDFRLETLRDLGCVETEDSSLDNYVIRISDRKRRRERMRHHYDQRFRIRHIMSNQRNGTPKRTNSFLSGLQEMPIISSSHKSFVNPKSRSAEKCGKRKSEEIQILSSSHRSFVNKNACIDGQAGNLDNEGRIPSFADFYNSHMGVSGDFTHNGQSHSPNLSRDFSAILSHNRRTRRHSSSFEERNTSKTLKTRGRFQFLKDEKINDKMARLNSLIEAIDMTDLSTLSNCFDDSKDFNVLSRSSPFEDEKIDDSIKNATDFEKTESKTDKVEHISADIDRKNIFMTDYKQQSFERSSSRTDSSDSKHENLRHMSSQQSSSSSSSDNKLDTQRQSSDTTDTYVNNFSKTHWNHDSFTNMECAGKNESFDREM